MCAVADYIFFYNTFCKHNGESHLKKAPSIWSLFFTFTFPLFYFPHLCPPFFCLNIFPHTLFMFYINRKNSQLLYMLARLSRPPLPRISSPHSPISGPPKKKHVEYLHDLIIDGNVPYLPLFRFLLFSKLPSTTKPSNFYHPYYSIQLTLSHHTHGFHLGKMLVK